MKYLNYPHNCHVILEPEAFQSRSGSILISKNFKPNKIYVVKDNFNIGPHDGITIITDGNFYVPVKTKYLKPVKLGEIFSFTQTYCSYKLPCFFGNKRPLKYKYLNEFHCLSKDHLCKYKLENLKGDNFIIASKIISSEFTILDICQYTFYWQNELILTERYIQENTPPTKINIEDITTDKIVDYIVTNGNKIFKLKAFG